MRLFFLGLHLPETLPGLEQPLPGPAVPPEVAPEARVAPQRAPLPVRGSASLTYEVRRHEDWWW